MDKPLSNSKNIIYQSSLYAEGNIHIGDIYNINGQSREIPFRLNTSPFVDLSDVIGRDNDLANTNKLLNTSDKVTLVNGLGGIGKTTLAKYFIANYRENYNYVAWINSTSNIKEAFLNNIELLDSLAIRLEIEALNKGIDWIDNAFSLIINRMRQLGGSQSEKKNLLIIDNAGEDIEHSQTLDQIAMRPNWKVLVTSREKLIGFTEYELGFLSAEDAKVLFYKYYKKGVDDSLVTKILKTIGYHTLSIELISKNTNSNPFLNLSKLNELVGKFGLRLRGQVDIKLNYDRIDGYTTITKCLQLAFDISDLSKNEFAVLILTHLAALPSKSIEVTELAKMIQVSEEEQIVFSNAINILSKKGWLLKKENSVVMHRIVQDVIWGQLSPRIEDCKRMVDYFTNGIDKETISKPSSEFEQTKHVEKIEYFINKFDGESIDIARLLNQLSELYRIKEFYQKAFELQSRSIQMKDNLYRQIGLEHAISYSNMGVILRNMARFKEAFDVLKKAIDYLENNPKATNNKTLADAYSNISVVLRYLGELENALSYQLKSLGIRQLENNKLDVSYNNLSILYGHMENLELSFEYRIKANEILEREKSHNLPASYNNLGILLRKMGKPLEAVSRFEKAIDSSKEIFGKESTNLAIYYQQLGNTYLELKDWEKSIYNLKIAKAIQEKNNLFEHIDYAYTLSMIGKYFEETKYRINAVLYYEKALLILKRYEGNKNFVTNILALEQKIKELQS